MANKHTKAQREFIVRKIAAFEPPRAIVIDFCAVFSDTKCDENDVKRLDPGVTMIAPELHTVFLQERERVMLDPASATFADQKARLIALSQDVKFYRGNNQIPESRAVMRQIAEETGAVGGAKGKAAGAPVDPGEPIVAIERIIIDPKPPAAAAVGTA